MTDSIANRPCGPIPPSRSSLAKILAQTTIAGIALAVVLFLAAGQLGWVLGWIFVGFWFVTKIIYLLYLGRRDPALLAERAVKHANTKNWDRAIMTPYLVMSFVTFIVAGLDAVRFEWSGPMPLAFSITGLVAYLLLNALAVWATMVNPYHSSESRIQTERGHVVVTTGPYRYLRHPTYLASILMWIVTPFMLGSWLALIPGSLAGALMILRTAFEDRMLRRELTGYVEYAQRVRYRLLPGIW